MNACSHCGTLSRWPELCVDCFGRGVLTHRPEFARGTGKVLEPGSATPTGMRAVGLALVLIAMLGALGLAMREPPKVAARPHRVEPYVAEPARVIAEQPRAKVLHKRRVR